MRKWLLAGAALGILAAAIAVRAEAPPNAGTLKIGTPGMVVELDIRGKKIQIPPNKDVMLPAGVYEVTGLMLHAQGKDEKGRDVIYRIDGIPSGELKKVAIKVGETTTLTGGQPLKVTAPVSISEKNGIKTAYVGLGFIGQAGESYRTVVYKGRVRMPNPQVQFVDSSGRVLNQGNFEYG